MHEICGLQSGRVRLPWNMAVEVDGPLHVAYNIPCFQNIGFIGVQFAHSVADVLNKYYEQFPCMGTPK